MNFNRCTACPSCNSTFSLVGFDEQTPSMCERCRTLDSTGFEHRKQKQAGGAEPFPPKSPGGSIKPGSTMEIVLPNLYHKPGQTLKSRSPPLYEDRNMLLSALRDAFQRRNVDFSGSYVVVHHPTVSDKHRIRMITNEIWEHTGYRFTVKDHPRIKNGQKTRLCCSQDAAHNRRGQNAKNSDVSSDRRDIVGRARYPCRSHLTISSQKAALQGHRLITIRMRHYDKHEPYPNPNIPSTNPKTVWEHSGVQVPLPAVPRVEGQVVRSRCENEREISSLLCVNGELDLSRSSGNHIELNLDPERGHGAGKGPETELELEYPPPETHMPEARTQTFQERMCSHIHRIRDFCDGLEYQLQFNDYRMLDALEREGASFLRLVDECLREEGRL